MMERSCPRQRAPGMTEGSGTEARATDGVAREGTRMQARVTDDVLCEERT